MSNTLIAAINNLAGYDTHEVEGLGKINIRKMGLDDIEKVEAIGVKTDSESASELKSVANLIATDFIVDDKCQPIFTSENLEIFEKLPLEFKMDILKLWKESFQKITKKVEDLAKKQ